MKSQFVIESQEKGHQAEGQRAEDRKINGSPVEARPSLHAQPEDHLRVLGALEGVHLLLAAGGEDGPLATFRQVVQADGFSCREEVKKILELKNPESNRKKRVLLQAFTRFSELPS